MKTIGAVLLGGLLLLGSSPAFAVANAMAPGVPYLNGGYAKADVKVIVAETYAAGDPCGVNQLYSRGILEGRGNIAFGTVATTAWACRALNSTTTPVACTTHSPMEYQAKGNWKNSNGTNTTNVGSRSTFACTA
jgi:hypothetical protein